MGCCCSRDKEDTARHSILVGVHLLFIATLVVVACTVYPLTAIGIAPSAIQVGDSTYALVKDRS